MAGGFPRILPDLREIGCKSLGFFKSNRLRACFSARSQPQVLRNRVVTKRKASQEKPAHF